MVGGTWFRLGMSIGVLVLCITQSGQRVTCMMGIRMSKYEDSASYQEGSKKKKGGGTSSDILSGLVTQATVLRLAAVEDISGQAFATVEAAGSR